LPAPGPLRVRILSPVRAPEQVSARDLLAETRRAMLDHLGEPDLSAETPYMPE
jgi:hypothetical protein